MVEWWGEELTTKMAPPRNANLGFGEAANNWVSHKVFCAQLSIPSFQDPVG